MSKILLEEELGYTVEIVDPSVPATWTALAAGEVDVFTPGSLSNKEALVFGQGFLL